MAIVVNWNGVDVPEELKDLVDEPTSLPEGTELDLVVEDASDSLDEAERAAVDAVITRAWASVQAGEGRSAEDVLADLAKR